MIDHKIDWISRNILPFEREVRRWIQRSAAFLGEEDDLIQEAYCRIARADGLLDIQHGRAYFYTTVKNLVRERLRRESVVRIEAVAEIETLFILDETVSIDEQMMHREQLAFVMNLVEQLPDRCRRILLLRRVEGLSQRETAQRVGVSENVVEKQTAIGMRHLLEGLAKSADQHHLVPSGKNKRAGPSHGK